MSIAQERGLLGAICKIFSFLSLSVNMLVLVLCSACVERKWSQAEPQIVGGWLVDEKTKEPVTYYSTVALSVPSFLGAQRAFCSGTLIGPRTILTAAHCVRGPDGMPLTKEDMYAIFGSIVSKDSPKIKVLMTTPHEQYNYPATVSMAPQIVPNDIALVFLEQDAPKPFTPVSLNKIAQNPGTAVWIAGYGVTLASTESNTSKLRAVSVAISEVKSSLNRFHTNALFKGSCSGDSGGPVYVNNGSNGWSVAGIVSAGQQMSIFGNPICTGANVFTDVSKYIAWIDNHKIPAAANLVSAAFGCDDANCILLVGEGINERTGVRVTNNCSEVKELGSYSGSAISVNNQTNTIKVVLPVVVRAAAYPNGLGVSLYDTKYKTVSKCLQIQLPRQTGCEDFGVPSGPLACMVLFKDDMQGQCERMSLVKRIVAKENLSSDPGYQGQALRLTKSFPNGGGVPNDQGVPPALTNASVGSTWRAQNRSFLDSIKSCGQ